MDSRRSAATPRHHPAARERRPPAPRSPPRRRWSRPPRREAGPPALWGTVRTAPKTAPHPPEGPSPAGPVSVVALGCRFRNIVPNSRLRTTPPKQGIFHSQKKSAKLPRRNTNFAKRKNQKRTKKPVCIPPGQTSTVVLFTFLFISNAAPHSLHAIILRWIYYI